MLLINELEDVFREPVEGTRDDAEEEKDVFRTPANAVALTAPLTGLELGGAA